MSKSAADVPPIPTTANGRRKFLIALGGILAAPFVASAKNLMKVVPAECIIDDVAIVPMFWMGQLCVQNRRKQGLPFGAAPDVDFDRAQT